RPGRRTQLVARAGVLDAAAVAAPPGGALRLDDEQPGAFGREPLGRRHRLVDAARHDARLRGHAVRFEDVLALVFVEFHALFRLNGERKTGYKVIQTALTNVEIRGGSLACGSLWHASLLHASLWHGPRPFARSLRSLLYEEE